jgi:hypothetical protein
MGNTRMKFTIILGIALAILYATIRLLQWGTTFLVSL